MTHAEHPWEAEEDIAEAIHGSIDPNEMRRRGIDPGEVIDFSTNVNPYGASPRVRHAVCNTPLDRYPDRECVRLREMISLQEQVDAERIIVGNGSSELLQAIAQLLIRPADSVLVVGPTYSEYRRASCLAGARVGECRARPDAAFAVPVEEIGEALRRHRPKVVFICNPNNPTGQIVCRTAILDWIAAYESTFFVVDEAYMEFAVGEQSLVGIRLPNLIVLKSLTKSHALAGLRVGYAVASPRLIRRLCQRRVPWSVSAPAQAAGIAALEEPSYLESCLARLREAKIELLRELIQRRWSPVRSAVHFFVLPVDDAAAVREHLLESKLLVRDCHSFGLANYIRVAVRTREENQALIACLGEAPVGQSRR